MIENQIKKRTIKIVAISDTHDKYQQLKVQQFPEADIFIHAGDFTRKSRAKEFEKFRKFITSLPYKHKIVIPGNHDFGVQPNLQRYTSISDKFQVKLKQRVNPFQEIQKLKKICTFVSHGLVEVQGLRIFGSPHVNAKYNMGFTYPNEQGELIWGDLPQKIDILVTHNPPFGILDKTVSQYHVGCKFLREKVQQIKPKLHIFGHIHESAGNIKHGATHFYNVAHMNEHYKPTNKPQFIEIELQIPEISQQLQKNEKIVQNIPTNIKNQKFQTEQHEISQKPNIIQKDKIIQNAP